MILETSYKQSTGVHLHLGGTRLGNGDGALGLAGAGSLPLNGLDNVKTLGDLTEHDVLSIEPRGDDGGDEELGAVGVWSGVGHGQESGLGVLQLEVLVGKLGAVDGLAAGTIAGGEVTTLQHEVGDDSVEAGSLVAEAVLASAELSEVLGRLGDNAVDGWAGRQRRKGSDNRQEAWSVSSVPSTKHLNGHARSRLRVELHLRRFKKLTRRRA